MSVLSRHSPQFSLFIKERYEKQSNMKLQDKTVVWRIQAPAHMGDREAAEYALSVIRDESTDALVFEVDGREVDLGEAEPEV
jgi:hypothetical protein